MIIDYVVVSGEPKPGHEFHYWLAWKHRDHIGKLLVANPWWKPFRYTRLLRMWHRVMNRFHSHAQDKHVLKQI